MMTNHDTDSVAQNPIGIKPRLVLMGEFSAGKSTLTNILLSSAPLPMRVTATRLPPVHVSYGEPGAVAVGRDGTETPIALDDLESVCLDDVSAIRMTMEADTLQLCDLVDMPGISDPSMPQEIWENVVGENDHVIWCTHATQAWRQSEAAIWNMLRERTRGENLLLITQFDKLQNDRDRDRVRKRVEKETEGLFSAVYPVSLLSALNADEDEDAWEDSGAGVFSEHLIEILLEYAEGGRRRRTKTAPVTEILSDDTNADSGPVDTFNANSQDDDGVFADTSGADADPSLQPSSRIVPRRVQMKPSGQARPRVERRLAAGAAP